MRFNQKLSVGEGISLSGVYREVFPCRTNNTMQIMHEARTEQPREGKVAGSDIKKADHVKLRSLQELYFYSE